MYLCKSNDKTMEILTLEIDENSKKGKALIDFLLAFYSEEGDVQVIAIDGVEVNSSSNSKLNLVAESSETYIKKESSK